MEIFVQSLPQSSEIDSHMHGWKSFKGMAPKTCMLNGVYLPAIYHHETGFFSSMTVTKWKTSKPGKLRFCVDDS